MADRGRGGMFIRKEGYRLSALSPSVSLLIGSISRGDMGRSIETRGVISKEVGSSSPAMVLIEVVDLVVKIDGGFHGLVDLPS